MKTKAQKQKEAVERNLRHISTYIAQAIKKEKTRHDQLVLVMQKLGVPKTELAQAPNCRFAGVIQAARHLLAEAETAAKEAA
jgi:hypothetical protein